MAGLKLKQVRTSLPLMISLVLIFAVASGTAEQPAEAPQAPAAAAGQAPAASGGQAAAPVAQPTQAAASGESMAAAEGIYGQHVKMWAYADTRVWDPLGSASLSSVISYSQLYNQLVQYDTQSTSEVI